MRKCSLFLLLATSAIPASAAPGDGDPESRRSSRSETSDNKPQRAERAERTERREARERPQRQIQVERRQDGGASEAGVAAMRRGDQQNQQQPGEQQHSSAARGERLLRYKQQQSQRQPEATEGGESRPSPLQRRLEAQQAAAGGQLVPRQRRIRTIPTTTQATPQPGQTGPTRSDVHVGKRHDRDNRNRWSSHWRNDHRYNWRRHRDHHRSTFRIGFYYDPFGYSYNRFGIGSYLYPNYYQSSYWINDPWQYRLPPAYGPFRWVRYHNDAVLIDTWTGEVVDVIYGFFW